MPPCGPEWFGLVGKTARSLLQRGTFMKWSTFAQICIATVIGGFFLLVLLGMIISACETPDETEPPPTTQPTRTAVRTPTATPTSTPISTVTPTPFATATATVVPSPTSTALPIPTPTLAPLGARPTVTPHVPNVTPRPTGLGVGRQTVIDAFEDVGFGIDFEDAPLFDGTPRSLGTSGNGKIIVELVRPSRNLTDASVTVGVTSNNNENVTNGLAMLVLLNTTTSWEGGTEWLTNAIGRIVDEETIMTTRNGYRIRLEFWDLITGQLLYLDIMR